MRVLVSVVALVLASLPSAGLTAAAELVPMEQTAPGLLVQGDMALGAPGPCSLQSRFSVGDRVVIRAKVFDAHTGQPVEDGSVVVRFDDGSTLPMVFGPHPPPHVGPATDMYWVAIWVVTPDVPLGVVRYTIEAQSGPRQGTFVPFNNVNSLLTVVPRS